MKIDLEKLLNAINEDYLIYPEDMPAEPWRYALELGLFIEKYNLAHDLKKEGKTLAEIASCIETPESTVKNWVQKSKSPDQVSMAIQKYMPREINSDVMFTPEFSYFLGILYAKLSCSVKTINIKLSEEDRIRVASVLNEVVPSDKFEKYKKSGKYVFISERNLIRKLEWSTSYFSRIPWEYLPGKQAYEQFLKGVLRYRGSLVLFKNMGLNSARFVIQKKIINYLRELMMLFEKFEIYPIINSNRILDFTAHADLTKLCEFLSEPEKSRLIKHLSTKKGSSCGRTEKIERLSEMVKRYYDVDAIHYLFKFGLNSNNARFIARNADLKTIIRNRYWLEQHRIPIKEFPLLLMLNSNSLRYAIHCYKHINEFESVYKKELENEIKEANKEHLFNIWNDSPMKNNDYFTKTIELPETKDDAQYKKRKKVDNNGKEKEYYYCDDAKTIIKRDYEPVYVNLFVIRDLIMLMNPSLKSGRIQRIGQLLSLQEKIYKEINVAKKLKDNLDYFEIDKQFLEEIIKIIKNLPDKVELAPLLSEVKSSD